MKHVHYDKIVAKAANMDLVVFSYCNLDRLWGEDVPSQPGVEFIDSTNTDYFLCLPQYKEDVLRGLNGEVVESSDENAEGWSESSVDQWSKHWWYMLDGYVSRIKPKKEKRWIATFPWSGNAFYVTPESFASESLLNDYIDMHYGRRELMVTHEIEVEV